MPAKRRTVTVLVQRESAVTVYSYMNYRTVPCYNRKTNKFVGYLGTNSADLSLVQNTGDTSTAWCKWVYQDGNLYLAKETTPQDRWLGLGSNSYAGWGLTWYDPIVVNADKTISLKSAPERRLYGPFNKGGVDYLRWSEDDTNDDILRIELTNPWFWLRDVPDNTPICDINLPGTHDSAAINPSIVTPWSCHYSSIKLQLLRGVRLLDVRLQVERVPPTNPNDPPVFTFNTCHGNVGLGLKFHVYEPLANLLFTCNCYVEENPSEFIALSLKIDDWNGIPDSDIPDVLKWLKLSLDVNHITRSSTMPRLKDVAGTLYLLDRIKPDLLSPNRKPPLPPGIASQVHAYNFGPPLEIPDNTPGVLLPPLHTQRFFGIYVQDQCENLGSDPEAEKFRLFKAAIAKKTVGTMLLNFASGTKPVLMGVYIQGDVLNYIDTDRPTAMGWSLFDYEDETAKTSIGEIDCVEYIISSNFGYKW